MYAHLEPFFACCICLWGCKFPKGCATLKRPQEWVGSTTSDVELLHRELGTRDDLEWWRIGVSGMVYVEIPRRNRQSCVVELESDLKIVKDDCTKSCSGKVRFIALVNALSYC